MEDDMSDDEKRGVVNAISQHSQSSYKLYQELISKSVAREVARIVLPLNFYTQFYWKVNLHNLLHFIKLRIDEHAQYEIREYAKVFYGCVKLWLPMTAAVFEEYVLNSMTASKNLLTVVKGKINGEEVRYEESKLSKQEWELWINNK